MRNKPQFVTLAVLLAGCASSGQQVALQGAATLNNSTRVVSGVEKLGYESLAMNVTVKFAFDAKATVWATGEVRRFAKGFALPTSGTPYSIRVVSQALGSANEPAMLYPEVRLLDAAYQTIEVLPPDRFTLHGNEGAGELSAELFVNDSQDAPAYILITNRRVDDGQLVIAQNNQTGLTPVYVGTAFWYVPSGSSSDPVRVVASPTGRLETTVVPYRPLKVTP